LLYTDLRLIF